MAPREVRLSNVVQLYPERKRVNEKKESGDNPPLISKADGNVHNR